MGRLLVILLIILLPLRGWSAERMAIQMSQGQMTAAGAVQQSSMPADCPMLAQSVSETEKSSDTSKSHSGCQTCQLCMSLFVPNFSHPSLLTYERQAPPVSLAAHFVSADLTRQVKPPIL